MLTLVYDPNVIADSVSLANSLGISQIVMGVPPRYADSFALNASGYAVVRETWKGFDVLNGPVTTQQIAGLPDPGIDPVVVGAAKTAQVSTILGFLQATPIDPALLDANLEAVAAYRNKVNPTAAESIAVLNPLIDVVADLIRYVLSR